MGKTVASYAIGFTNRRGYGWRTNERFEGPVKRFPIHGRSGNVVTAMDLPQEKGTYVLISNVQQMKRLAVGALGDFDITPGFYAYVGSAFGSGGLAARVTHHLESTAEPHWHIDYLLRIATPIEVWFTTADRKLEKHWVELLENAPQFRVPIPQFGSSDYHRSRSSHLFYSKRRPSFRWFQDHIRSHFEGVGVEQ